MRRTVLVVEDDPCVRLLLEVGLRDLGADLVGVPDGPSALQAAARRAPDVVLLDVGLPGPDGLAVCGALRAMPATSRVPIALVSGFPASFFEARGRAAGADAYFAKPFRVADVRRFVEEHLRAACGC